MTKKTGEKMAAAKATTPTPRNARNALAGIDRLLSVGDNALLDQIQNSVPDDSGVDTEIFLDPKGRQDCGRDRADTDLDGGTISHLPCGVATYELLDRAWVRVEYLEDGTVGLDRAANLVPSI